MLAVPSRLKDRDEPLFCTYCDALLPTRFERDHFPVPKALGGVEMVAACMNCHELKDRTPIDRMPADYLVLHFGEIPMRAMLTASVVLRGHRRLQVTDIFDLLEDWGSLSRETRILLAKMTRVALEFAILGRRIEVPLHRESVLPPLPMAQNTGNGPMAEGLTQGFPGVVQVGQLAMPI